METKEARVYKLAHQHGLVSPCKICFSPTVNHVANGRYCHEKNTVTVYTAGKDQDYIAKVLAHEIKHAIDFQGVPRKKVTMVGIAMVAYAVVASMLSCWLLFANSLIFGIIALPMLFNVFYKKLSPWEVSANVYSAKHWREYRRSLTN